MLSPRLANDLRLSNFFVNASGGHATAEDCPGCFGLGAARVTVADVGLTLGGDGAAAFGGRRYQLTESLVWQKGKHRLRFGFDWEHVANTFSDDRAATQVTLWSPARVRQLDPTIPLPASFTTLEDILRLPLQRVTLLIGSGATPWRDFPVRMLRDTAPLIS